jgi:hypothetical protein
MAKLFSELKFTRSGMRLAFDRIEEDGVFQNAVKLLIDAGVAKGNITSYVLFNFIDTPKEADYRMRECVKLGIRPYPQQYTPLKTLCRKDPFVGKCWTRGLVRAFRHFWLMGGYYSKYNFQNWARENPDKSKMDKKDWEAWNGQG